MISMMSNYQKRLLTRSDSYTPMTVSYFVLACLELVHHFILHASLIQMVPAISSLVNICLNYKYTQRGKASHT